MSEWVKKSLGDFMFFQRGHDLSRNNMKVGNIPVAGSNGVIGFHNASTTIAPGITIGRSGNIGTPHFYQENFWAHNTVLYVKDFKGNDPLFCYYLLKTIDFSGFNTGSAVPTLNRNHIHEHKINTPPVKEQKSIASVLSSLDNKIDLLHRQNKTLESIAETLFRQWFVEEAQDDWEEINVLNIFSLVGGGTPKTSIDEYWNGNIPWISGGDISQSHKGFISKTEKSITELGLKSSSTKLLPKLSTIISARGTVGKYAMLEQEMCFSQSNYGIIPKGHNCYYFVYLLIGFIVDELLAAAYGSVFDTITTRTFESVDLKLPEMSEIINFEATVIEHFKKKELNSRQIQTLEKLRDTLLPKLMSGEVRVSYTPEEIKQ
ncbi:hypothetical protein AC068_12440 [Morganella morganii]|uniref:restriction endonuclease subunit S n=1 Tax=Morganella morganii TaxID=582 RepID=UPI0006C21053|nr:restriction endonuclease subunit S [Morganella morganii]KOO18406.1 hypothetical protein AC068_12440 [Morganella morganii]